MRNLLFLNILIISITLFADGLQPSGAGTEIDPYQVESLSNLLWISTNSVSWNSHIIQTADIDASVTSSWNSGEGFSPIGNTYTNRFTGNYNGDGYIVSDLYINRSSTSFVGLFGVVSSSKISNLGIENADITGLDAVGGLVGQVFNNSDISNSYSTGSVNGNNYIGGLAGRCNNSTISSSYSMGSASGNINVGGLVALNDNAIVADCYSTGSVNGDNCVGGLVGVNDDNSTISNSYSAGSVNGNENTGGLVGLDVASVVSNSFWDTETSGQTTSAGGTGKITTEMKTQSTFLDAGWDFIREEINGINNFWAMFTEINNGYPSLPSQLDILSDFVSDTTEVFIGTTIQFTDHSYGDNITNWEWDIDNNGTVDYFTRDCTHSYSAIGTYSVKHTVTNSSGSDIEIKTDYITVTTHPELPAGIGTEADPYQISNLEELRWLSQNPASWNSHFIQTADVDATDTQNWNSGAGFNPIGNSSIYFTGNYNGDGCIISYLYINRPSTSYIGLFGFINSGKISTLGIENADITGDEYVGSFVGENEFAITSNCYSSGSVNGNYYVGGLVGDNYNTTISNCYSMVSVNGNYYVGGLVGDNYSNAIISNSYNTGSVNGIFDVGGLVGDNYDNAIISNCYSTGSVNGDDYVGGLVGWNDASAINNSFWDTETSGQSTSDGGTDKTTAEMKVVATYTDTTTIGLDLPWDFADNPNDDTGNNDIWNLDGSNNNGYPYMIWETLQINPAIPQNVVIVADIAEIIITWDPSINADSYKVFSSDDPYSDFTEDTSGTFIDESWSVPFPNGRKFYYVVASSDASKDQ